MSKPTVFVVDDDDALRESLRSLVESVGLNVETYASPCKFLDFYEPDGPGCLVLGLRFPHMSGIELQETLAERGITIPIIIVTGYGDVPTAVQAMKRGAVDFIEKPFDPQALLDLIHQCLERHAETWRIETLRGQFRARLSTLSPREREVMNLIVAGHTSKAIAKQLGISSKTADAHRARVMQKMQTKSTVELVKSALTEQQFSREIVERGHAEQLLSQVRDEFEHRVNKRIDQPRKANEFLEGQVAERKGAEEALRKSEAIARLVLDNLPAPAAYVDIHQTYQFVNKAYETWLGRPWDDIVGRHVCDVLGNKIYDGICSRLDRALAGTAVNFEMTIVLRGEERIIYTSYVPHTGKQGEIEGLFALITDITERKRAEETVRLSEARLKAILAHAPAEISLKDPEGRYILVNREFAKRYSLNEEEVKGKTPFGILPDDLAQYSLEHDREVLETGKAVVTDHSVPSMDGLRPLLEVKFPIFDADGAISAIGSIATDISELKRAEEALRESEQRLRVIAEATPVPIAITRFSDGVVLYANPRVGPAFGLPPDEVVGRKSLDFYKDPADRRALLAALEERGYVDNHELELRRADGTTRSVLLSLRVITFEGEQAILFGLFDITERKRADEAARESETRVRAIVDNIADCVITIKENGRIQSFNAAAEHAFGYTADEVLGQNVRLLMAEPERKRHEGYIANYLRTGKGKILGVGPREVTGKRKDGSTVPLEITVSEMVLGAKRMFIGALRDITERKLTEQQLQQALKMEAVGQLTGGVAHDFNNLLTVILGNLQLLERCVEGDEQLQKQVRAASDAALRGAELTKRLLAFSRRQVLEPEVADLNKLVTGMDDLLRRTLGEAIGIRVALAGDLWWTRVDAGQLEVALLNLVLNARDAMPKGGKLTIETANARLDDEYTARYPYVTAGPYVMLAVTDSGTGMSAEVIERVFEPFFTTKETGKGTGLGV